MRRIVLFSLLGVTAWTAACAVKNPPPPADLLKDALTASDRGSAGVDRRGSCCRHR